MGKGRKLKMTIKIIMLIMLIIGFLETFFNIITKLIETITFKRRKDNEIKEKHKAIIKLVCILMFLVAVVFFLIQSVMVLALWLGIDLNKSLLEYFR